MDNYPMGAADDPRAPWNQVDPPEVEVEVWASNTLSRAAIIMTKDYKELPPDAEKDEEGHITYSPNRDFSDCDLSGQFKNQHYTIKEIFESLRMTVDDVNAHGLTDQNLQVLNRLAKEGEYWNVDEEEVVIA